MSRFFLLLLILYSVGMQAEVRDSLHKKPVVLDEVVVTSFKQDKSFRLSPISATVLSGRIIETKNMNGMKDFSSFVPNFFAPDYGSKLTSPVYIRGIGSKINAPSVGLYVDDMPFFEKSAFDFDFFEVDRVEVLRGPQGTLYGRNTMGGIINVYTKSPRKYQGTHLNLLQGNYTSFNHSMAHYGRVNEKIGYSISGNYTHSNGYFTNKYTGKEADELSTASTRIRIEWELSPRLKMDIISSFDYSDQGGYPYAEYNAQEETFAEVNYDAYSLYRRKISTSGVNLEYKEDGFLVSGQTSFQYLSDKQGIDQDFSPASVYYAIQQQQQRMWSEEINVKSQGDSDYKWLLGAFGFYQDIDNKVQVEYFPRSQTTIKDTELPTHGFALYHQSTFENLLFDGLSLTAGIRYDYEKASSDLFEKISSPSNPSSIDGFNSDLSFSQLTPKIALQYTLPSRQMMYATISKGYKTGGFNTSFDRDEDRSFDPEHSWNYEIGGKLHFFDHRLQVDLALFYIDWKDQQISQPLPIRQQGSMLKNAGRSESKGVEISLTGRPVNGLALYANYGYTHATFKEYQRSETLDYSGKYIPFVPSSTYLLGADYTLYRPRAGVDKITFSADYTATGKLYWNDSNTLSQSCYGLLNGKIALKKKNITFGIWAKNLTDEEYAAFVFEFSGKNFAQRGKPCTFGGNIVINL